MVKVDTERKLNLSNIIYGAYTRHDVLRNLVYQTYGNSSIAEATKLNIFVDLNSILHGLYSEYNRIIFDNITDISAGIINLCAHYRSFFRFIGVDTRFFLINSLNTCDINTKFVAEYNAEFKRKSQITNTKKIIDNNMSLLKILCPYLPAIYYVESEQNFETAVIIAHIIEQLNDPNPNLIISRDFYPIQLVTKYRWTSYLCPKKALHRIEGMVADTSWMLPINEKANFKEEFWKTISTIRNCSYNILSTMSPINYSLFTSMTKVPERNLKPLVQNNKARDLICSLVGSEDVKIQLSQVINNPNFNNYPLAQIDARYKVVDIDYMLSIYRNSPESKQLQFVDLEDVATVNRIAAKYYVNNPLELQKL